MTEALGEALDSGLRLQREGRLAEAVRLYRSLADRFPREPQVRFHMACVYAAQANWTEALRTVDEAIEIEPHAVFRFLRADVLERSGLGNEALAALRELTTAAPDFVPAFARLGELLAQRGDPGALETLEHAVSLKPDHVPALNNLAFVHLSRGDGARAEAAARAALAVDPRNGAAHAHLGRALHAQGAFTRAAAELGEAVSAVPDSAPLRMFLANTLLNVGRVAEALDAMQGALALGPADSAQIESALLLAMHYDDRVDRRAMFAAHRAWAARHGTREALAAQRARGGARKLRVGYVSPRLHDSSVGSLLLPVLEQHDRERFEIVCYAGSAVEDAVTARMMGAVSLWRRCADLDDRALAQLMRDDGIDIAVDLAGHTPEHRLAAFALRPAPVALTWLDYFDTTGLDAIDAILTDAVHSPPGDEAFYTERIVRLPHLRYCWKPSEEAPAVEPPAPLAGRRFVFGSFNRLSKLSPATLQAWCEVLRAVPQARFVLKSAALNNPEEHSPVRERFEAWGVDPARIELRGSSPWASMMREYSQLDAVLDSFPYNGGVTTLEALWMGRPVLTIRGDSMISRQSAAILECIGRREWIAGDRGEFVENAVRLASMPQKLAEACGVLRTEMAASPVVDVRGFTRELESAYRRCWRSLQV